MLPLPAPLTHLSLLQGQPGRKGFPGRPGPDGLKVRELGCGWAGGQGEGMPGEEDEMGKPASKAPQEKP